MTVRLATKDDVLDVMYLGRKLAKQAGAYAKWDGDRIQQLLELSFENDSIVCFLYETSDGEIAGGLLAVIAEVPTAAHMAAMEIGFFLDTTKPVNWISLVREYEGWARYKGVKDIFMSHSSKLPDPSRVYEKMGFSKAETIYHKGL
jgi:hypothetical protein